MRHQDSGVCALVVPEENAQEAAIAAGELPVYGIKHLTDAVKLLNQPELFVPVCANLNHLDEQNNGYIPDFAEVKGQAMARRAMEIAAAGGHNSLMIGPPGTGKSMLASRLSTILPPMSLEETLETSQIYSVLGLLNGKPIVNVRPYRAPHHTISDIALIGGGKDPRPGEISLAHNGVLFLDELPEFKRNVLEVLRQPLENGYIAVSRAAGSCVFPARFMLVGAMNPCPCGRGDAELGCTCKLEEKRRYRRKVSGPLLDRIDLHIAVKNLSQDELINAPNGESSEVIRKRVLFARAIQNTRFHGTKTYCNAQMTSRDITRYCNISASSQALLRQAISRFNLSPRAYDRILKVARSIADLAQADLISELHILEAINYRSQSVEQFQ